jgi:DNA-binding LacI/PurR family transcriptional regulator
MRDTWGEIALDTKRQETYIANDYGYDRRYKEAGLKIPGDIAIAGFSNNKITTLVDPQMTTVDQPSYEMGRRAAEILISTIEDKSIGPTTIVLDAKLIVRAST